MAKPNSRFHSVTETGDDFDLAEAALELSAERHPELDVASYVDRIDQMCADIQSRSAPGAELFDRIRAINNYLFDEAGFGGNQDDYYDPRNSFLNDVIDRRLGIPISLSVVYLSIAERLGLPFQGVSFPGHFLIKCPVEDGEIVLDPYSRGMSLDEEELMTRLHSAIGTETMPDIPLEPLLRPTHKKDILVRMLRNLKMIYETEEQYENALWAANHIVELRPQRLEDFRDRGLILAELGCPKAAADDLQHYLDEKPKAHDHDEIRDRLISLRLNSPRLQ